MQPTPPPFGYGVYEPPASSRGRPAVILWYRAYALIGALVYGAFLGAWLWASRTELSPVAGIVILSVLVLVHVIGMLVPFKPWGWTYGLVLICFGLISFLFPFSIGLIIFWNQPHTKAAFRRF